MTCRTKYRLKGLFYFILCNNRVDCYLKTPCFDAEHTKRFYEHQVRIHQLARIQWLLMKPQFQNVWQNLSIIFSSLLLLCNITSTHITSLSIPPTIRFYTKPCKPTNQPTLTLYNTTTSELGLTEASKPWFILFGTIFLYAMQHHLLLQAEFYYFLLRLLPTDSTAAAKE